MYSAPITCTNRLIEYVHNCFTLWYLYCCSVRSVLCHTIKCQYRSLHTVSIYFILLQTRCYFMVQNKLRNGDCQIKWILFSSNPSMTQWHLSLPMQMLYKNLFYNAITITACIYILAKTWIVPLKHSIFFVHYENSVELVMNSRINANQLGSFCAVWTKHN